jgi:CubicO group peptidase (beta-lactamase class C family)
LMRQAAPVSVPSIKAGASQVVSIMLNAILPAPKSQMPESKQYAEWDKQYKDRCGVDLRAVMDWKGPQAQTPVNDHTQADLYQGYGSSKPWQEGRDLSDTSICDDKNCVSLNQVARSVYKQIGCKVVGYAFFAGDSTSGSRARYDAFGKARKSINPPETDFAPTTKMQIASSSKVLTALTTIRVMGSKIDSPAFTNFPSNWALPQNSIVKNITSRQLVSQTSGIQQYYAGNKGQDFASLQAFFTQPVPNPNAAYTCPGAKGITKGSNIVPNPIIMSQIPCYTDTNFGVMRLVLPRFAGLNTNDPSQLAQKYVQQVQANVFTPLGIQNVGCKPPLAGNHALLYSWARPTVSLDWGDATLTCGDWGWYVSVEDYAKVLVSLNSRDHKILSDAEFKEMELKPSTHPIGFDINADTLGNRWLEKNGAQGGNCDSNKTNCATQTTSVGIFGGRSGKGGVTPISGVAGVLFLNSDIAGQPNANASTVLLKAFQESVRPKP